MASKKLDTRINRAKKYLANNPIIVAVWIVTVFLSSLITVTQGVNLIARQYYATLGHKQNSYDVLKKISPNQDINIFIDKLGKPSIINKLEIKDKKNLKEYVFVDAYYFVQTVTNDNGKVLSMAITSRKRDFNPSFYSPGNKENIPSNKKIILNSTTFSMVADKDDAQHPSCYAYFGANRFKYFEKYYEGNPGNYQSYYVGVNDAGYTEDFINNEETANVWSLSFEKDELNTDKCEKIPKKFRESNRINTYIETSPFIESEIDDYELLGVDANDVRVFNNE